MPPHVPENCELLPFQEERWGIGIWPDLLWRNVMFSKSSALHGLTRLFRLCVVLHMCNNELTFSCKNRVLLQKNLKEILGFWGVCLSLQGWWGTRQWCYLVCCTFPRWCDQSWLGAGGRVRHGECDNLTCLRLETREGAALGCAPDLPPALRAPPAATGRAGQGKRRRHQPWGNTHRQPNPLEQEQGALL